MAVRNAFTNEDGFTTAGVAIALLLVAAIIFASLHSFWVSSSSGNIQYVADAGALAADSVVADYISIGQVVDASLLSLSLLSLTVYAVSAVAAFIPGGQGASAKIAQFAFKIVKARKSFARTAQKGLNALQNALPILCAARASECIQLNAKSCGIAYKGSAIALPLDSIKAEFAPDNNLESTAEEIEKTTDDIAQDTENYKKYQETMDKEKEKAWIADCGSSRMCMRERAQHLSNLTGDDNPNYKNISDWSFSVGLQRAKKYYKSRYEKENPQTYGSNIELMAESIARKQFYKYAYETVSKGSVVTKNGLEIPSIRKLPRNTSQIKNTYLYTEAKYPVSINGKKEYLHACEACPYYLKGSAAGLDSVQSIDTGKNEKCPSCKYSATTLGRVPSASTSINNGFEYYYKCFQEAADAYKNAAQNAGQSKENLDAEKEKVSNSLKGALKEALSKRYDPQPAGRYGCICIVAASRTPFFSQNSFYKTQSSDNKYLAISGATLVADTNVDEADVLSSIGSNLFPSQSLFSGISKTVFGTWSELLKVYAKGTSGLEHIINKVLGTVPLVGNDLSSQAVQAFKEVLTQTGLQPANLYAYKPIIVNTSLILERDNSAVSKLIVAFKKGAVSYQTVKNTWSDLNKNTQSLNWKEKGIVIARISLQSLGFGIGESELLFPFDKACLQYLEEGF